MKNIITIIAILTFVITLTACSSETNPEENTKIILDVTQYSRISSEELIEKMGNPISTEDDYLDGTLYNYDTELGHFEFIIHNNQVTRLNLHSKLSWEGKGTDFDYQGKNKTLEEFGIKIADIDKNAEINYTGESLKVSPVTEKVAEFRVSGIKNEKTFELLKVTYDTRPYNQ